MKKKVDKKKIETTQSEAEIIRAGLEQPFWKIISKIVQENIDWLGQQITDDDDLSDAQRNLIRKWRKLNKQLLSIPHEIIEDMKDGTQEPTSFSVYAETYAEILGNKL